MRRSKGPEWGKNCRNVSSLGETRAGMDYRRWILTDAQEKARLGLLGES